MRQASMLIGFNLLVSKYIIPHNDSELTSQMQKIKHDNCFYLSSKINLFHGKTYQI